MNQPPPRSILSAVVIAVQGCALALLIAWNVVSSFFLYRQSTQINALEKSRTAALDQIAGLEERITGLILTDAGLMRADDGARERLDEFAEELERVSRRYGDAEDVSGQITSLRLALGALEGKIPKPQEPEQSEKLSESLRDAIERLDTLEKQVRVMDDNLRRAKIKK